MSDLLGLGIYSVPEASRLIRVSPARLRRWLRGYEFRHGGGRHSSPKLIRGQLPVLSGKLALSFLDLQEARCLDWFRERGVGWGELRELHEKARLKLRTDHPFSTKQFKAVGRDLVRDYATESNERLLVDFARDQLSFREFLQPYIRSIEFLDDVPARWFPLDDSKRIVVDPKHGFGRPTIAKYGVSTAILSDAYRAERSFKRVADWYGVDVPSVKDAVRFERLLAAA